MKRHALIFRNLNLSFPASKITFSSTDSGAKSEFCGGVFCKVCENYGDVQEEEYTDKDISELILAFGESRLFIVTFVWTYCLSPPLHPVSRYL